jgi:hypothetical protein
MKWKGKMGKWVEGITYEEHLCEVLGSWSNGERYWQLEAAKWLYLCNMFVWSFLFWKN